MFRCGALLLLLAGLFGRNSASNGNPLAVECKEDRITVSLSKTNLTAVNLGTISLKDVNCDAHMDNGTHVIFAVPFDGCMTMHNTTDKTIIYYNSLLAEQTDGDPGQIISRTFQAEWPFQCTYSRTKILSVVSFSPREKIIYTKSSEFGNFTYLMDIYPTDAYEAPYGSYPVYLDLGEQMHLQVEVRSNDSQLALFLEKCWATPIDDPHYDKKYTFIKDGCTQDNTMVYNYEESAVQQFSIDAFRFLQESSEVVHLHCMVEACRMGDNSSKCFEGCASGSKRKRRALELDAAEGQIMTLGPILVTAKKTQAAAGSSSMATVGAIAGVLALLVLVLFVALIVVYKKRNAPMANVAFKRSDDSNRLV